MKVKTVRNSYMRNYEQFQFMMEVKSVFAPIADSLNLKEQFAKFVACLDNEDEALQKIVKSATTEEIEIADLERDNLYIGMVSTNKTAAKYHYDNDVVAAAKRLKVLFDTYGDLARKPLNEETSGIYNMMQELRGKYAVYVGIMGILGWVDALEDKNKEFDVLVKDRNAENAAKTQFKMKECRNETDDAYFNMVEDVNAMIRIEGAAKFVQLVNSLNTLVDKYNLIIAQRYGRNNKDED